MNKNIIDSTIDFFVKLSNLANYVAEILRALNLHEEYYVYVPNANKPKYIHKNYKSAKQEAKRLASKLTALDSIEILQVVKRLNGDDIPF
ncbi:MAG: hypothetical protein LUH11_03240 [Candidatus Gastranaerophilales bacterium]|nr:hypothetical protein [Candidatus Gastranaerophilales bacterium]